MSRSIKAWRLRRWVRPLVAVAAAALSACGGGDGATPATALTAGADSFTLDYGQTGQLLANDRIGTAAANAASGGNALFTLTTPALPAGVTVDGSGTVSVAAPAVPGVVSLAYRLCEAASSSNCVNGSAQVTVPMPPIVANADSFNLAIGASGDALANDTLRGTAATAATVSASATGTLPTGVALSGAGVLSVAAGAAAGTSSIGYRICQIAAPTNCANATINLTVPALGMLTGRAIDAATGTGVAGVTVSAAGQTATTDAAGAFSIAGLAPTARLTVRFDGPTHAESAGIARIDASASSDLQVRLLRVAGTTNLPVARDDFSFANPLVYASDSTAERSVLAATASLRAASTWRLASWTSCSLTRIDTTRDA